jgi:hypothetical protein
MPQVVFKHALLDSHLCGDLQVLHFAAAARACVQTKVGAARTHALRRFVVNLGHDAVLKAAFLASDLDRNHLKGQGTLNKNHFAIGPAGDALGIHVQRVDSQPAFWQVGAAMVFCC